MNQESFEPPVVVKLYRLCQTLAPLLGKFPKPLRYSLGQTIDRCLLAMLELIFEANALPAPLREGPLLKAHAKCELTKLLVRMACERDILEETQFFQLTADLREVSRMLMGWIKYTRQRPVSK